MGAVKVPRSLTAVAVAGSTGKAKMCQVDWQAYFQEPSGIPSFGQLVAVSGCDQQCKSNPSCWRGLPTGEQEGPVPRGFIFDMGQWGASTAAAMLAASPSNRVFLDAQPVVDLARRCWGDGEACGALRGLVTLMIQGFDANSFFVFPGDMGDIAEPLLQVFPKTPWVFLLADPAALLQDMLFGARHKHPPCLREAPGSAAKKAGLSREARCTAAMGETLAHTRSLLVRDGSLGLALGYGVIRTVTSRAVAYHFGSSVGPAEEYRMQMVASSLDPWDAEHHRGRATPQLLFDAEKALGPAYRDMASRGAETAERLLLGPLADAADALGGDHGSSAGLARVVDKEAPMWLSSVVKSQPMHAFECPPRPPPGYPLEYPILDLVKNWSPDDADSVPEKHYLGICRFDYQLQYASALAYRDAEVPFIVYNMPALDHTVRRYQDSRYVDRQLKGKKFKTEVSVDNHFMYYNQRKQKVLPKDWTPPTQDRDMTYGDWLHLALMDSPERREHYYFRVSDRAQERNKLVARSVPMLEPGGANSSLFLKDPEGNAGVHCRFGMHGVIAEAHFDGSRNMVAMLSGKRRWILSHPRSCQNMHMYPPTHPSGRHSAVDWSQPDLAAFPRFSSVTANEVILRAGEVLYVPTDWIHYIVNLGINVQCNSRSGSSFQYRPEIEACNSISVKEGGGGLPPGTPGPKQKGRGPVKQRQKKRQKQKQKQPG